MAHIVENKKGFKVIACSMSETAKFGGIGICDRCNNSAPTGYLVCVLNHWYCEKCYREWEARAKYYPEDSVYEEKNFNRYKKVLSIE